MTQDEFEKEFLERLRQKKEWNMDSRKIDYYEDGFTAEDENTLKFIRDTNIRYHKTESDILMGSYAVITTENDSQIDDVCRFSMDYLYKNFAAEGWDEVWQIVEDHLTAIAQIDTSGILSSIMDYEAIREHLIIRPLNYSNHRYELKNCIYRQTGDIALVLYLLISDSKVLGLNTSKIQTETFQAWNRDKDEVWESALLNTYAYAPPRMYLNPEDTCDPPYTRGAFMAIGSKMKIGPLQIPVVTTTQQINGAIALFYPNVKERIAEMIGGSYYVAFTSIHDARIHRAGTITPKSIRQRLNEVNKMFAPSETLSRKVFYFDADKKEFTVID